MEEYMMEALKEAKKALKYDDVPVGAIIVSNGKIIARAHNEKEKQQLATKHAEIIAIERANKKRKNWYLDDCEMYITMEPCLMCCGAIIQSRIKKIAYGTNNIKFGYVESVDRILNNKNTHKIEVIGGILEKECSNLVKEFFKSKRK